MLEINLDQLIDDHRRFIYRISAAVFVKVSMKRLILAQKRYEKAGTYSRPGFQFRRICLRVNYLITFRALRSMVRATKIRKITPLINCCVADS